MFYDTSSTYREAHGEFFRSGTLLPDGLSSVPFFLLRSFCSFYFLFLSVFFLLVSDCTTSQRRFPPAVKYPLFRCSIYLFWVATTVFFLFFPCTHPLRKSGAGFDGSSSTTISSQICRHTRSPSSDLRLAEVFMITFGNMDDLHLFSNDFFRSSNTEWPRPKQGLSFDSLFLISFSC